jgi:organic radical activating enzyme
MPVPATQEAKAPLVEIFSSIQGEGILVGCRQIFIRFAGCNLDCRYCDTDYVAGEYCRVENPPGSGNQICIDNPIGLAQVYELIEQWCEQSPTAHHSISLTGGEPLQQHQVLNEWLPELRKLLPIYLETNGTLPNELEQILEYLDWISMDIKLNSLSGAITPWDEHRRFLQLANQRNCYVKMVVAENSRDLEIQLGAELVAGVSSEIPLILQPVTLNDQVAISTRRLLEMQQFVSVIHANVRIIPQTHRFLGLL